MLAIREGGRRRIRSLTPSHLRGVRRRLKGATVMRYASIPLRPTPPETARDALVPPEKGQLGDSLSEVENHCCFYC